MSNEAGLNPRGQTVRFTSRRYGLVGGAYGEAGRAPGLRTNYAVVGSLRPFRGGLAAATRGAVSCS